MKLLDFVIERCKNDDGIPLTNLDIINIFKYYTDEPIMVLSDEKINNIIDIKNKYTIFNLDWLKGTHWVSMHIDEHNKIIYFFDSYGNSLPERFIIPKEYTVIHNNYRFQQDNTVNCGWWSILHLLLCDAQ
ncbi:hypothetical protein AHEVV2_005 [Adoxophyes honmai entomopoxvirus 'L' virophage 2]|nr:hypothetical protein AHEVV2_005 [Adoxophyes honmai entomopoxvirus 'L' virophage 2]